MATALGTVALALAAHQLKRRRRRKKQVGPEPGAEHLGSVPIPILMARKAPSSVKKGGCGARGQPQGVLNSRTGAMGLRLVVLGCRETLP